MKKILLLLFALIGAFQVKAQQFTLKPSDSLLFKTPKNFQKFNLNDSTLFKGFSTLPKSNQLVLEGFNGNEKNAEVFYSRMSVLKIHSNDKMPVAKLYSVDRMPIKRIKVIDPLEFTEEIYSLKSSWNKPLLKILIH
jgi:hypothetical protein